MSSILMIQHRLILRPSPNVSVIQVSIYFLFFGNCSWLVRATTVSIRDFFSRKRATMYSQDLDLKLVV